MDAQGLEPRNPLVSIIIPTYNYAAYLPTALKSCLSQSYNRLEIIVVDDGSTDGTKEVIAAFGDNRIVYLFQDHNGVSSARNAGLQRASGSFIAFLDADDYLTTDSVETRSQGLSRARGHRFRGYRYIRGPHRQRRAPMGWRPEKDYRFRRSVRASPVKAPPFCDLLVLLKDRVAKLFRFPAHLSNGEDLVYFSKVFFGKRGCFLPTPTAVTRSHPDSLRHRVDEIRKQGRALVDTIFDDPYYRGRLDHLRKDFTAYRYTEFFRRFYQTGDEKAAGRCLARAIAARPLTLFKIDYWIKLVRLHARKASFTRSLPVGTVMAARGRAASGESNHARRGALLSIVSSAFYDITKAWQIVGFSLLALALLWQLVRWPGTPDSGPFPEDGPDHGLLSDTGRAFPAESSSAVSAS